MPPETAVTQDPTPSPSPATTTTPTTPEPTQASSTDDGKPSLLNDKKGDAPAAAPEKYEAFTVPDGYKLDDNVNKEATELFRSLNLPQEGAQKLVDFYIGKLQEVADRPIKHAQELQEKWVNEVKADPVIGKKLPEVKTTISRALDTLGDAKMVASFRAAMDETGAGNHPAFIRALYQMAQKLVEGQPVQGNGPARTGQTSRGQMPSAAQAMYPNNP